jgi:leucyl/phenylalanyl-tRNA---protein transferase
VKQRTVSPAPEPLDPRLVLGAYAVGAFPMADARTADHVHWVEPRQRAVLPLDGFHLSGSLRKVIASGRFRVTADQAFAPMIELCAQAAADRPDTWINGQIEQVFIELHRLGFAHSIEVWQDREFVGGLYGLALGRAFFGESMVSRARDASKVALGWLVARLRVGGFSLLDCQFMTPHLASLGAVEISADRYSGLLADALSGVLGDGAADGLAAGDFFALERADSPVAAAIESAPASGKVIAQLLGQTS